MSPSLLYKKGVVILVHSVSKMKCKISLDPPLSAGLEFTFTVRENCSPRFD